MLLPTRNKIALRFVILLLLACSLASPMPVRAQEAGEIRDTFDDPALQGWEHSQNVSATEGVLRIEPENAAFRLGAWYEPSIQIDVQISPPGGVFVHYQASDQGGYHLQVFMEGERAELFLDKETNGTHEELGVAALEGFSAQAWNTLEVSYNGGTHLVTLNGTQVFSAHDDSPLPAGAIGLMAIGENTALFDNLVITSGPEGVPPEAGEAPAGEPHQEGEPPPAGEESGLPPASIQTTPQVVPQPGTGPRSLLEEFLVSGTNAIDLPNYALNLGLAALLSFILSRIYIHWGASLSNRRKFAANFMLMTVTTTFIILVVRSSVALSLGLVGALSIVRFRAAIKEPEELAYLFLAIGIGIGLGDNQRLVTLLAFTAAAVVLGLMKLLRHSRADINMHLTISTSVPEKPDLNKVLETLKPYCSKCKLVRFEEQQSQMELSFVIELVKVENLSKARNALQSLMPGASILFLDNKGIW